MRRFSALLLVALSACTGASASEGPPHVDLVEFSVTAEGRFETGDNVLSVSNSGEFGHTIVITDESGHVVAASDVIAPGEEQDFAVELGEGLFEISCRIVVETNGGEIVDHYEEGMVTQVRVGS